MSHAFRELLKIIGSGPHTGKSLTRSQAAEAMRLMLTGAATPAQIGAFLIAHRIKRPTGEELAGMLDACQELGPRLESIGEGRPIVTLGIPYDGRSRTAPLGIVTALILAAAGQPVLMHGGDRMPTKYGLPLIELWQALGVDWTGTDLTQLGDRLQNPGLAFCYVPRHFPQAAALVDYRDQIGKRPPLATLELMWSPYAGPQHRMMGFVHPPTETMMREALALHGVQWLTTIKGLEGSPDLPHDRAVIVGLGRGDRFDRLCLNPWELGYSGPNLPMAPTAELAGAIAEVLQGKPGPWRSSAVWNGGFYLWQCGICDALAVGFDRAAALLDQGRPWDVLCALRSTQS
ncbi:MAG: hypothetical protein EA001_05935 [Oscillatoriales cyanobacterium]|nr:MAG: hypothetical protein EA001_05935 [Oscillatoriales cyanobacterium]